MPDYFSGLTVTAGTLALAEAARKALVNRRLGHGERARDYLVIALVCMGCASFASAPAAARWADRVFEARNVSFYVASAATVLSILGLAGFLRASGVTGVRVRTVVAGGLACLVTMTLLYLLEGTSEPGFATTADDRPAARLYNTVFHGAVAAGLCAFIERTAAEIRRADRALRLALGLAVAGMAVGVVPVLWKLGLVLVGGVTEPRYMSVTLHLSAASVITFSAGSAAAAAVRSTLDLCHRRRRERREQALCELWTLLGKAGLHGPLAHVAAATRVRGFALGIREAQRTLRPYVPSGLTEHAREEADERGYDAAFVEAVELRAAMAAFAAGYQFEQPERDAAPSAGRATLQVDEDAEFDRLAALAWFFQNDPAVAELARAALDGSSSPE
ncbi:hypothetical protein L3Q67_01825 [Saccharothrix sp. AJ9571]|nr:hypothetical protein L3Q67_01825 [Saccharothrix sp. AJ9571]